MKVDYTDNPDGSGTIAVEDLSEDEKAALIRYGIMYVLKLAIEEDRYNPDKKNEEQDDEG